MSAKRHLITFCVGAAALLTPFASTAASPDECSEDMLMSYYPEPFVKETLEQYQIPQSQRSAIIRELAEKDKEVVPMVEERAAKMSPNPLRDPKHRQEAVKIFRDTLYELFADVMQNHGVNDREQIMAMLNDIQQQKAKQFAACMDMQQPERTPREPGSQRRDGFSRQQRGPNGDYNNYEAPEDQRFEEQTEYDQGY